MTTSLKVLIADDEAPARKRLKSLLADISDITVTGEAANGREALTLAAEQRPDVLLLDIRMPVMDGIEAAGVAEPGQQMQQDHRVAATGKPDRQTVIRPQAGGEKGADPLRQISRQAVPCSGHSSSAAHSAWPAVRPSTARKAV